MLHTTTTRNASHDLVPVLCADCGASIERMRCHATRPNRCPDCQQALARKQSREHHAANKDYRNRKRNERRGAGSITPAGVAAGFIFHGGNLHQHYLTLISCAGNEWPTPALLLRREWQDVVDDGGLAGARWVDCNGAAYVAVKGQIVLATKDKRK